MKEMLAIRGGVRAVPEGMIQKWPPIDEMDRRMVLESLEGRNHAFGPNCQAFQKEFAAWNGNKFAVTTNSGTAALHMGLAACDVGAGDEVIVPAYSWSSSATCVLHHNAIPIFVDMEWASMNPDVRKIEAAITPRTKAIIALHLHGLAMDMDGVMAIARGHGLKVIEDACQSHGAKLRGRKVGTMGHCAAFSFNQNKSLCSGEGGMFVTDDADIHAKALQLWSFGETRTPVQKRDYHAYALGWMYRNNDLTAAFGRSQLSKLNGYLKHMRANARRLTECLEGVPYLLLPGEAEGLEHSWYNYTIRFDLDAMGRSAADRGFRDRIVEALVAEGVETGIWQGYILPAMTVFQARNGYGHGCPWECRRGAISEAQAADLIKSYEENYDPRRYPVAQKHCDTHTGMTTPLRPPNGPEVAEAVARGIRKVLENIEQLGA